MLGCIRPMEDTLCGFPPKHRPGHLASGQQIAEGNDHMHTYIAMQQQAVDKYIQIYMCT